MTIPETCVMGRFLSLLKLMNSLFLTQSCLFKKHMFYDRNILVLEYSDHTGCTLYYKNLIVQKLLSFMTMIDILNGLLWKDWCIKYM